MFILRKKRIVLILCSLFISFSVYLAQNKNQNRSYDITQVSSIPVTKKVIVIDAGHGRGRRWRYSDIMDLLKPI